MGERQKKAVIVGATSGIGLELVKVLTAKGWQVGIAGRRQERLQQIQSKNLDVVATECFDITKEDAPRRLLTLIGKMGGVDLYFHSAGVGYQNPALDIDKEMTTVATNVVGFTQMVDTAFHYFEEHPDRPGHLAVISSIAGTKGLGAAPSYSSTKRYVNHYMECLAQLCHIKGIRHIHLHDIRPGFVRTPLLADGHHYPFQLDPHKVALSIEKGIRNNRSVITIDWRYRLLVSIWRLFPRWLWVRMPVASKDGEMKKALLLLVWSCCSWLVAGAQMANPWGKALVPDMIADASIQLVEDTFYCYATTDGYGRGLETSGPPVVWKSKDFLHWSFEGVCFPSADGEKYWAPSKAVERNGRWYIYPTVNGIMHVGVANSPDGPFRLAKGKDEFTKPYAQEATLRQGEDRGGIDAEVFVDDDGQVYVFWGGRHVAKLADDMMTMMEERTLETRRKEYSEGPIFFKRKGIYYYLYTIGGDENYEYYYMMSRTSPMGPYEIPIHDLVSTTNVETGVFGPGHGCVFNVGDDYYFAFLEYGRRSTNRQTYVNKLLFNEDGTIRQVEVTLDGVGALRNVQEGRVLKPVTMTASSTMDARSIRHNQDIRCQRTEQFVAAFAADGANGSRWMAAERDTLCWLMADLGEKRIIGRSELSFVRPTAGHAYVLEGSMDGQHWERCGGHVEVQRRSPHVDEVKKAYRYVRVKITKGIRGVWEWRLLAPVNSKEQATANVPELPQRSEPTWGDWQSWGEQEDGAYWNPVIPADYSDLDCIRVGDDYYAISSTMQFAPGMTVLHSKDMVNWEIAGNAVEDVSQISKGMTWQQMDRYGKGVWAGTIRYHQGRFYVFFGTPDEGYFMTSAEKAEGPWEPLTVLLAEPGWDDCTALWDEKGKAWFVGTCFREGYKTYRFPMAEDGKSIDSERATLINEGNGREANKLLWHDGYYYLIFSEHKNGVGRYVMAKRDRRIDGKFLEEQQLLLPCVKEHEPNQGGIVEGKDGRWYFLTHHGSGDWSGRIVSLLPVEWVDGWPMMGDRRDSELGKMAWSGKLPTSHFLPQTSYLRPLTSLQRSDDFDNERLGVQWQWNYQPRKEMFSLTERKGWLRLRASVPLEKGRLLKACNTLTQRSFRARRNEVVVKMDISQAAEGMRTGLCHFAERSASLGLVCENGKCYVEYQKDDHAERGAELTGQYVWLKSTWGLDGKSQFFYSTDGDLYLPMGTYQLSWGFYRGDRIGIFCFNDIAESGWVDVDYLHYQMEK